MSFLKRVLKNRLISATLAIIVFASTALPVLNLLTKNKLVGSPQVVKAETSVDSLQSHLQAHYDFEDAIYVGKDVSGKNNHGVAGGKLAQSTDAFRGTGSANFDSSNHQNGESYLEIPATLSHVDEISIMAWVKFDRAQQADYTPIFYFTNSYNADFELICNSPRSFWGYEGFYHGQGEDYKFFPTLIEKENKNGPVAGNAVAQSTRWHHVAVTLGGGYMKIFVNGQLAAQRDSMGTPNSIQAIKGYIGGDTYGGSSYHGLMDDLRIYDKVLTADEIASVNDFATDDFLYVKYTFDDANNLGKDESGYNNDATVVSNDGALEQVTEGNLKAAKFDGKAYLQMPYAIVLGNQGMTVNVKLKVDKAPEVYTHLIDFCSGYNLQDDIAIRFQPGISALGIYANTPYDYFDTSVSLPVNEWVTISMTFDASAVRLYLDGALIFEEKDVGYDASDLWNTAFNHIGKSYDWESSFVGLIDEVDIYSRTFTQDEIISTINTKNPYLSSITVNGESIIGFTPTRTDYYTILSDSSDDLPTVNVTTVHPETSVNVTAATSVPGTTTIVTRAENGKQIEYKINYLKPTVGYDELKSTAIGDVEFDDDFWSPTLRKYATVTAKYVLEQYSSTNGDLSNYKKIADGERNTGNYVGTNNFWAADYYTVIAGAERLLRQFPDSTLQTQIDGYVDLICAAAETMEDGYFGIYNILNTNGCRFDDPVAGVTSTWSGQNNTFDLDQMGALCEAGVEYYLTTGKTNLLRAAVRFAECAARYSMDQNRPMISVYNFAQLGLTALYEFFVEHPQVKEDSLLKDLNIDEGRYLMLSEFFIKSHGVKEGRVNDINYSAYSLDDALYYYKESPTGAHAGSANCFMTSLIEAYRLDGDVSFAQSAYTLARNVFDKQMYVTGGTGATEVNEAYGGDYVLPNDTAYCETCTAGYMMRFCNSMGMAFADSEFSDVVELEMYNTLLGAVGEDGKSFFYKNIPCSYESRWDWHPVPCCTKMNLMTYGNLATYLYYYSADDVYVNQYVGSTATITLNDGNVVLKQTGGWSETGETQIIVQSGAANLKTLYLRLPSWSENNTISVNGTTVEYSVINGYAKITGSFADGDTITVKVDMTPQVIESNENVKENIGLVAFRRGPMIYHAEGYDNKINGIDVYKKLSVATDCEIETVKLKVSETDVVALKVKGCYTDDGTQQAYTVTLIPFYARAYRGTTSINVYLTEHTHSYSDSFDGNGHFELCPCGHKTNPSSHDYGEWILEIPAEIGKDGTKGHYHCDDCNLNFDSNYNVINDLTIPALTQPESSSSSSEESSTPSSSDNTSVNGSLNGSTNSNKGCKGSIENTTFILIPLALLALVVTLKKSKTK